MHSNPNIDGNGITESEWQEWSSEEQETYLSGGYDVCCHECGGRRVVAELDETKFTNKPAKRNLLKRIDSHLNSQAEFAREDALARKWGW